MDLSECRIKHIREHVEIFDRYGNFVVSGDTEHEAIEELKEILVTWARQIDCVYA